jgi:orotidine-5'-phosphate decarboxylase
LILAFMGAQGVVNMERNLIFSLDTKDRKTVLRYARKIAEMRRIPDSRQTSELEKLSKSMFAIKIGVLNMIDCGLPIIRELKQITKMEIICDLKLADIPYIAGEVAKKVAEAGADYLVVQSFVGEKTVNQVIEAVPHMKIILVSEMTHNEGGFTQRYLDDFALIAERLKVFGIIGPGNRPERIRRIREIAGDQMKIIAAGVSVQQGGEEKAALDAGADFLIKGRSIMEKLDEQIGSTAFDFDLQNIKVNVLLPIGIYSLSAMVLNIILSKLALGDVLVNISVTAVFTIVGVILHNVIRRR